MQTRRIISCLGLAGVVAISVGCASGSATKTPQPPNSRSGASTWSDVEDEILRELAAVDRRIALRARITPLESDLRRITMPAMLREDPTMAVVDGAIDPFSFDARAAGLSAIKQKLDRAPESPSLERDLLARLVDEENARLAEERALPRSASTLVRAIVDTWKQPESLAAVEENDRWLARRLAELRASLEDPSDSSRTLDSVRARELDDALDALERATSTARFVATTGELVRVRDALETVASSPAKPLPPERSSLAAQARAHLGVTPDLDDLARALPSLAADLRERAERALTALALGRDDLATSLDERVFVSGVCVDAVPGSRIRSMAAAREREAACHLRHLAASAEDDRARALLLAAMHEHVVVASWVLEMTGRTSSLAQAEERHRLLVPVAPSTRARYERIALARPIAAIGAAETVRMLLEGDPTSRAKAWSKLGDVPFDIARRELDASHAPLSPSSRR